MPHMRCPSKKSMLRVQNTLAHETQRLMPDIGNARSHDLHEGIPLLRSKASFGVFRSSVGPARSPTNLLLHGPCDQCITSVLNAGPRCRMEGKMKFAAQMGLCEASCLPKALIQIVSGKARRQY